MLESFPLTPKTLIKINFNVWTKSYYMSSGKKIKSEGETKN